MELKYSSNELKSLVLYFHVKEQKLLYNDGFAIKQVTEDFEWGIVRDGKACLEKGIWE